MFKKAFSLSWLGTRTVLTNVMLVVSAFVWYATILFTLMDTIGTVGEPSSFAPVTQFLLWGIHFSGLIFSALLGVSLSKKIGRTKFLMFWMFLSVISSLMLFTLNTSSVLILSLLVLLLGVSLGLGMPACMSFYSDCVPIENRGRVSGVALLISGIGIFAFAILPLTDMMLLGISLAIWRLLSLVAFFAVKSSIKTEPIKDIDSYKSIIGRQSFLTYFIPWIMFSLINYLAAPLEPNFGGASNMLFLVKTAFLGMFAILGGFFVDSVGRKRIAIAGFAMLGLSSAALGVSSEGLISLYFSSVLEGAAWGLLLALFLLILWGDLSHSISTDKYYAIGVAPFFISKLLELTVGNFIGNNLPPTALFPFTSFFLFLAVLPLVYAPETLPEKSMKDRKLKSYLEKAQKVKEKYS